MKRIVYWSYAKITYNEETKKHPDYERSTRIPNLINCTSPPHPTKEEEYLHILPENTPQF